MAIQTNLITRYTELLCLLFRYYIEGGKSCLIFGNLVHVALLAVGGSYFFSINNSIQTPSKVLFGESSSQNGLDGQGVNLLAPKEGSFNDCTSPDHPTVAKKRQNPSQNEENESILLQRELIKIQREWLDVEKERLGIERERLHIDRRRLEMEEQARRVPTLYEAKKWPQ